MTPTVKQLAQPATVPAEVRPTPRTVTQEEIPKTPSVKKQQTILSTTTYGDVRTGHRATRV